MITGGDHSPFLLLMFLLIAMRIRKGFCSDFLFVCYIWKNVQGKVYLESFKCVCILFG